MNDNSTTTYSLTIDDAIDKVTKELNRATKEFDIWLSMNAVKMSDSDPEYKARKQNVKILRLRQKEFLDMKVNLDSQADALLLKTQFHFSLNNINSRPHQFTKSRGTTTPVEEQKARMPRLGRRKANMVAKQ